MSRPRSRRPLWLAIGVVAAAGTHGFGQAPPPMPLPPTVTGPSPITPAAGSVTQPAAPIARFQDLKAFPPETVQAIYAVRGGAEWLWRMNQANGRFLPGIHPAVRMPIEADHDLRQAQAALALAEAARFTGDERYTARATQALLGLLLLTRTDAGVRVPVAPSERCNRVAFAATLVLAAYALPGADARVLAQAEELAGFLRSRVQADGSIQLLDQPAGATTRADTDETAAYPGLAVQALVASYRAKPDDARRAALAQSVRHYREAFKASPQPALAAALIPGLVEFALLHKDESATAAVFEMADWLCRCQNTRAETRQPHWIGSFRPGPAPSEAEPTCDSLGCVTALCSALKLTRSVPDLVRYQTYRQAAVDGLAFARALQFTEENTDHFDRAFRARFLVGGVHLTPTDGTTRIDATAVLVTCQLAFLRSGAEAGSN